MLRCFNYDNQKYGSQGNLAIASYFHMTQLHYISFLSAQLRHIKYPSIFFNLYHAIAVYTQLRHIKITRNCAISFLRHINVSSNLSHSRLFKLSVVTYVDSVWECAKFMGTCTGSWDLWHAEKGLAAQTPVWKKSLPSHFLMSKKVLTPHLQLFENINISRRLTTKVSAPSPPKKNHRCE